MKTINEIKEYLLTRWDQTDQILKTVAEIREYLLTYIDCYSIDLFASNVKHLELEEVRQMKNICVKYQKFQEAAICRDIEVTHKDFVLYEGLLIEFEPYDLELYGVRDEVIKLKHIKIYAFLYGVEKIL